MYGQSRGNILCDLSYVYSLCYYLFIYFYEIISQTQIQRNIVENVKIQCPKNNRLHFQVKFLKKGNQVQKKRKILFTSIYSVVKTLGKYVQFYGAYNS